MLRAPRSLGAPPIKYRVVEIKGGQTDQSHVNLHLDEGAFVLDMPDPALTDEAG